MTKTAFLTAFTVLHSFTAGVCFALAGLSQFNMHSTPARATTFTHVTETIGSILAFPLALQGAWLGFQLQQDWIMPGSFLVNSFLWAMAFWYFGVGIKHLWRRAANRK